jgi:hypothetical protein
MSVYRQRGVLKGCHILTSLINWRSDLPGITGGDLEKICQGRLKLRGVLEYTYQGLLKQGCAMTLLVRRYMP